MKSYNSTNANATKVDRIERAVELINSGAIFEHHQGVWRVLTDRFAGGYTITEGKFDCYDFTETLQSQAPCKHVWVITGAAVAMMIHDMRSAGNQTELDDIVAEYRDAIKPAPAAYLEIARSEYRLRRDSFKAKLEQRRAEEAAAVLIKSQPAGGARYGSIDI